MLYYIYHRYSRVVFRALSNIYVGAGFQLEELNKVEH